MTYYVWSRRGEVYHDATSLSGIVWGIPLCGAQMPGDWVNGPKPPKGRHLCHRCEALRAKEGAGG